MTNWQAEWPIGVKGSSEWWWLYARAWGDKEPTLYSVRVRAINNGTAWICNGHFFYPSDVDGAAYWCPAALPDLPAIKDHS